MKNRLKKRFLLNVVFFIIITLNVCGQDYAVTPLSDFIVAYKEKHVLLSQEIEGNKNITFAEKLALYESKIGKLRESFKSSRKSEYLLKTVKRARRQTCKGTTIRGVTKCEPVYVSAPSNNMYTLKDWVKIEGESKSVNVIVDSLSVTMTIKSTGTRINKAGFFATFKYNPKLIPAIVEKETIDLFSQLVKKE